MYLIVLPILWCVLIFYKIGKPAAENRDNPLSLDNARALRGIAATEIMLGHIGIYTDAIALFPFRKAGIFFTGIFFLLSGYANALNLSSKEGYIKGYLPKRLCNLLIPAYVAFVVGLFENAWWARDISFVYKAWQPLQIFTGINWFIWELLGLYVITYLVCLLFKLEKGWYLIAIISAGFVAAAYFLGFDETWYGSTMCYALGMGYYFNRDSVNKLFRKYPIYAGTVLIIILALFLGLFAVFKAQSFIGNGISRNALAMTFGCIILFTLGYVKIGNRVSRFLGDISFEIYLFHNMFLGFLGYYIKNQLVMSILVVMGTILFSFLYNRLYNGVIKIINKKINKKYK